MADIKRGDLIPVRHQCYSLDAEMATVIHDEPVLVVAVDQCVAGTRVRAVRCDETRIEWIADGTERATRLELFRAHRHGGLRMKYLGIAGIAFGVLSLVAAVVFSALAIWTGDDRWGNTSLLAFLVGVPVGGFGVGATVDAHS